MPPRKRVASAAGAPAETAVPTTGGYEVETPILNNPYDAPTVHWLLKEGETPRKLAGRRPSLALPPRNKPDAWTADTVFHSHKGDDGWPYGDAWELAQVNLIRQRVLAWREAGSPGASSVTLELLDYWVRDGRQHRLFFAQIEAAETVIFLTEARADFRQGIAVPVDEPTEMQAAEGARAFTRYCSKIATGSGKTTVMAMLIAWSVLNKLTQRDSTRFASTVLVVCPNVTIRSRLRELDPEAGEASVYRSRDLVPPHWMPQLRQGRVLTTNWHKFERQQEGSGGVTAKVLKKGVTVQTRELIHIGEKNDTARGKRYLTLDTLRRFVDLGLMQVVEEVRNKSTGAIEKVRVLETRQMESEGKWLERVLGDAAKASNLLVLNDEAHHAYRIRREADDEDTEEDAEELGKEATIWVEGLDRINRLRGINLCVDLSATPYFLSAAGGEPGKPFPWVVSDFSLTDAIESGLTKIPQLVARDNTGAAIPSYFNIWEWIMPRLTSAERGGSKGSAKPEAILRHAQTPITLLGKEWQQTFAQWQTEGKPRPPVFIIVCRDVALAKLMQEWIADDVRPTGIPAAGLPELRNTEGQEVTIRVDSKKVHESDDGTAKTDETRWMRFTLDTVGRLAWPADTQGRPLYPEGFAELAEKLERPLHPPGRAVRCIVSVGMLTEGWDCNTVTHIIGLRPFMSQLLCEQVVGRGLRRESYQPDEVSGLMPEEIAKVFGVPFELIPFKGSGTPPPLPKPRKQVRALPAKAAYRISFPRVEGYTAAIRNRVTVGAWDLLPSMKLDPVAIPPEVKMKAALPANSGRPTLSGPGALADVTLNPFRREKREQELAFELAADLTRQYAQQSAGRVPAQVLFPQLLAITRRYLEQKLTAERPAQKIDAFLSPYYGSIIELLLNAIRPDQSAGEAAEVPRFEPNRGPGKTDDVDFWTSREVTEVQHSHLNYVVADKGWEQVAAVALDEHPAVLAFVKNSGLGFGIPYFHNGQAHEYVPDFIVKMRGPGDTHSWLILEPKGHDALADVKRAAADRWVNAVNADGQHGIWRYEMTRQRGAVKAVLDAVAAASG
ncbi:MAG: BPTD_3080 family restriction endonuclease [Panacagrimonas sp.]